MSNDSPIRWDKNKKDQRDQEREAKDLERRRQHALAILGEEYKKLKRRLIKQPRTKQEVMQFFYNLMEKTKQALRGAGLESYEEFTIRLIEDKQAQWIALDGGKKNQITAYVPNSAYITGPGLDEIAHHNATHKPQQAVFETEAELNRIEFVRRVAEQEGFVGFVIQWPMLCAFFGDEELVRVGVLANSVGVGRFPTWKEFQKAVVADKTKEQKSEGN